MKQSAFQGSAKAEPFSPVRAYDPTAAMREQSSKRLNWLREDQQSALENRNRIGRAMAEQDSVKIRNLEQNAEKLAGFSKSIGEFALKLQKERSERLIAEGFQIGYEQGIPQEAVQSYKAGEQTLQQSDRAIQGAANDLEQKGVPPEPVSQIRGLSGLRKLGAMKGMAARLGTNYQFWLSENLPNVKVTIGDREVTWENANNQAERDIIMREVRGQYMRNFSGMNPAMVNEVAFPQIREAEARVMGVAVDRANKRAQEEQEDAEMLDIDQNVLTSENPAQAFMDRIDRRSGGDNKLRGRLIKEDLERLKKLALAGAVSEDQLVSILETPVSWDDGSTMTIAQRWKIPADALRDAVRDARKETYEENNFNKTQEQEAKVQAILAEFENNPPTEADMEAIDEYWRRTFGSEPPSVLKSVPTVEARRTKVDKEEIERLISQGLLTKQELSRIAAGNPQLFNAYVGRVSQTAEAVSSMPDSAKAQKKLIRPLLMQALSLVATDIPGSVALAEGEMIAERFFDQQYASYLANHTPEDAARKAAEDTRTAIQNGRATPDGKPGTGPLAMENRNGQIRFTQANGPIVSSSETYRMREVQGIAARNPMAFQTQVILKPSEMQQAIRALSGLPGATMPAAIGYYTRGLKGVSPSMFLEAQARVMGVTLPGITNRAEQARQGLNPNLQRILETKPSGARGVQVFGSSDGPDPLKPLRDLTAGVEAGPWGYDAMNTGGANGGRTAFGSGAGKDRFGRPLTAMTVGEVMNLQANGQIWAAGRYQFIPGTLREQVAAAGIKTTDKFDERTQDKLFDTYMLATIDSNRDGRLDGNWMGKLRGRWIGLQNVSDARITQAIQGWNQRTNDSQSPWRQPNTARAQLLYSQPAGPIVRSESVSFDTGQPGIDLHWGDFQFRAVLPGRVKDIGTQGTGRGASGQGYGNYIVVESIDPATNKKVDVLYAHLDGINVKVGQSIGEGSIIGRQGGSGRVLSQTGTIASIDFLAPAPAGSRSMLPYPGFDNLRRRIARRWG